MVGDVERTNGHLTIQSDLDRRFKRFRHARLKFRVLLSLKTADGGKRDFDTLAIDDPYAGTDVLDTTNLEEGCLAPLHFRHDLIHTMYTQIETYT